MALLGCAGAPPLDGAVIERQSEYRENLVELDGPGFGERLLRNMTLNGPEATAVQFNLIGSHDSPRARTVLGEDPVRLRLFFFLLPPPPRAPAPPPSGAGARGGGGGARA